VAAAYRRFHLRDALAEMFPLADWRSALARAGLPGAGKAMLDFG